MASVDFRLRPVGGLKPNFLRCRPASGALVLGSGAGGVALARGLERAERGGTVGAAGFGVAGVFAVGFGVGSFAGAIFFVLATPLVFDADSVLSVSGLGSTSTRFSSSSCGWSTPCRGLVSASASSLPGCTSPRVTLLPYLVSRAQ